MDPTLDAHGISLSVQGIRLRGGIPSVQLLVGAEERPMAWEPALHSPMADARPVTTASGEPAVERHYRFGHPDGYDLQVIVRAISHERSTLNATFTNGSKSPVCLRRFVLLRTSDDGLTYDGRAADWWLQAPSTLSRRVGNLEQRLRSEREVADDCKKRSTWVHFGRGHFPASDPRHADGRYRAFHDALTLYRSDRQGLVIGAVGEPVGDVMLNVRVDRGAVGIEVTSEMDDVLVRPGEARHGQEVAFIGGAYADAVPLLYRWVAAGHGCRPARPVPTGWCSWYGPYIEIGRDALEAVCGAVERQADRLRPDVIQIDDKWQKSYGDWAPNDRFPLGMAEAAARIRRAGCTPGIWMAAVRAEGKPAHWYQGPTQREYVDPTHPEVEAFIRRSVRARVAEGFRYFKFDFNHVDRGRLHDRTLTRVGAMRRLYAMLREEVGDDGYVLACVGEVERAVAGYADATRIGSDTCHPFAPNRLCDGFPANPMNLSECSRQVGQTAPANGVLFANDPDVVMVGAEHKGFMSYVGLLGGLAFNSKPLDRLSETEVRILERFQPVSPERGSSLAGATDTWHRLFGFVADRPSGRFAAVSWYNNSDSSQRAVLDCDALRELGPCHQWDFWNERYLGVGRPHEIVTQPLAPHAGVQWRFTRVTGDDGPTIVGSNLHIATGAAEVASFVVGPRDVRIDLLGPAGAHDGRLYLWSRQPLSLGSCAGATAILCRTEPSLYLLALNARAVSRDQSIHLIVGGDDAPHIDSVRSHPTDGARLAKTSFLT